jgi:hypothetical protein
MRQTRRTSFATPFVLVVTSGCWSNYQSGHNPPMNQHAPMSPELCSSLNEGDACNGGESCDIPRDDGCGVVGYTCGDDHKWHQRLNLCNPPPPGADTTTTVPEK